ncbi:carboxylating nicotinate-nucleotide diphosphorylase [Bacillus songklensis]|uniref:nicotinate-nucleotide diphosphorylase (carboxylating) n=1 Tax=Bacillus songklensis TaxID=1069116 RepID=A0ABV8B1J1_9BACI
MNQLKVKQLLEQFFIEDLGDRDVTSVSLFSDQDTGRAEFLVKEDGIISGLGLIEAGYRLLDPHISVELYKHDGDVVRAGEAIASVHGKLGSILSGERVILNLLQRMSGIATLTNKAVKAVGSSTTKICDTRKTTPGLRMFEKYAVRCGGGVNHRYGLYDGVMLKDNHIAYAGSILKAVHSIRAKVGHMTKIEVEIETKEQLLEAIEAKVDIIMFDNCSSDAIQEWITLVPPFIVTEASGGIEMERLADYGKAGVDYISLGMLTHSVKSLDISLDIQI